VLACAGGDFECGALLADDVGHCVEDGLLVAIGGEAVGKVGHSKRRHLIESYRALELAPFSI
jgi:hypothetical protein